MACGLVHTVFVALDITLCECVRVLCCGVFGCGQEPLGAIWQSGYTGYTGSNPFVIFTLILRNSL